MDQLESFLVGESFEESEEEEIDLKDGDTPAELFDNQGVGGFLVDESAWMGVELEEDEEEGYVW